MIQMIQNVSIFVGEVAMPRCRLRVGRLCVLKKFLTGEKNRTKKNTTEKMTTPMPMGRKQKKWMSLYMALVLTVTVGATTAFAAGDPLSVINNLSTFIFSLIRAIGLILLGC